MKRVLLLICLLSSLHLGAQERKFTKLKVFLDCAFCDMTYLMQEMNYLNFVRNTEDADVYVMVTTQITGGGGTGYTLKFTGQNQYEHIFNSIGFSVLSTSTTAETRQKLADHLSLGLASFWSQLARTEYQLRKDKEAGKLIDTLETIDVEDKNPWNNWVFQLGVSGYMQGQKTSESSSYSANFSSKQVTEKHKFYFSTRYNSDRREYNYGGSSSVTKTQKLNVDVSEAITISDHWSVGAFANMEKSDYANYNLSLSVKPAIEYSLFPYVEASQKQISLSYRVGALYNDYEKLTVFNETEEFLWVQSLNLGASIRQKWGDLSGEIEYESILDKSDLYGFNFTLGANIRLLKGLSFTVNGNYKITKNQINLVAQSQNLEDIILQRSQVQSNYSFYTSIGFSYTFGSMFNSIVNPRFGF